MNTKNLLKRPFFSLWSNKSLIKQLTWREIIGRYKGSLLGLSWSFFNPLIMLAVYTFVFSVVFEARWGVERAGSKADFALVLFTGLIIHAFFSEVLVSAPQLITSNMNFVKKVVFPLEILSVVSLGAALFHSFVSLIVLLLTLLLLNGVINPTVIFLPFTFLPLIPLAMGTSWFFSSLGVYVKDIGQLTGVLVTVLMFLSPIFYPIESLPNTFQILMQFNPLTLPIEESREVLIFGNLPNFKLLSLYSLISFIFFYLGFIWFGATRKGFSDVL